MSIGAWGVGPAVDDGRSVPKNHPHGFDAIPILGSKKDLFLQGAAYHIPGANQDVGTVGDCAVDPFGPSCEPRVLYSLTASDEKLMADPLGRTEATVQTMSRASGFAAPIAFLVLLAGALHYSL